MIVICSAHSHFVFWLNGRTVILLSSDSRKVNVGGGGVASPSGSSKTQSTMSQEGVRETDPVSQNAEESAGLGTALAEGAGILRSPSPQGPLLPMPWALLVGAEPPPACPHSKLSPWPVSWGGALGLKAPLTRHASPLCAFTVERCLRRPSGSTRHPQGPQKYWGDPVHVLLALHTFCWALYPRNLLRSLLSLSDPCLPPGTARLLHTSGEGALLPQAPHPLSSGSRGDSCSFFLLLPDLPSPFPPPDSWSLKDAASGLFHPLHRSPPRPPQSRQTGNSATAACPPRSVQPPSTVRPPASLVTRWPHIMASLGGPR